MNLEEKMGGSSSGSDFFEERKCDIYLRIYFRTIPPEEIRIVGNIPEFGSWSIQNSFPMNTDTEMYPFWLNLKPLKVAKSNKIYIFYYKNLVFSKKKTQIFFLI